MNDVKKEAAADRRCSAQHVAVGLRRLLNLASEELNSARTAAAAQGQLHEARVRHLEKKLNVVIRERDELKEQLGRVEKRRRLDLEQLRQEKSMLEQRQLMHHQKTTAQFIVKAPTQMDVPAQADENSGAAPAQPFSRTEVPKCQDGTTVLADDIAGETLGSMVQHSCPPATNTQQEQWEKKSSHPESPAVASKTVQIRPKDFPSAPLAVKRTPSSVHREQLKDQQRKLARQMFATELQLEMLKEKQQQDHHHQTQQHCILPKQNGVANPLHFKPQPAAVKACRGLANVPSAQQSSVPPPPVEPALSSSATSNPCVEGYSRGAKAHAHGLLVFQCSNSHALSMRFSGVQQQDEARPRFEEPAQVDQQLGEQQQVLVQKQCKKLHMGGQLPKEKDALSPVSEECGSNAFAAASPITTGPLSLPLRPSFKTSATTHPQPSVSITRGRVDLPHQRVKKSQLANRVDPHQERILQQAMGPPKQRGQSQTTSLHHRVAEANEGKASMVALTPAYRSTVQLKQEGTVTPKIEVLHQGGGPSISLPAAAGAAATLPQNGVPVRATSSFGAAKDRIPLSLFPSLSPLSSTAHKIAPAPSPCALTSAFQAAASASLPSPVNLHAGENSAAVLIPASHCIPRCPLSYSHEDDMKALINSLPKPRDIQRPLALINSPLLRHTTYPALLTQRPPTLCSSSGFRPAAQDFAQHCFSTPLKLAPEPSFQHLPPSCGFSPLSFIASNLPSPKSTAAALPEPISSLPCPPADRDPEESPRFQGSWLLEQPSEVKVQAKNEQAKQG